MAIELNHNATSIGATFPAAYWRISAVNVQTIIGQPIKHVVNINMDIFANAAASSVSGVQPVARQSYSATLPNVEAKPGPNIVAKCYALVSALPEMIGGKAV